MFFTIFCILSSCSKRLKQCTAKNYMIHANNNNYQQFFGKSKALYIRFYKKGCIYTPASQAYWDEASRLLPNMQFVSAECETQATTFCSMVKSSQPINVYPTWRLYKPNQTTYSAQFSDNNNIHSASTYFTNTATDYAGYLPFDNPLIEDLIPQSTNRFFKLYKYPIFILYNSNCEEDIAFVNQFYLKINNSEIVSGDYGFGKLDCSKYSDECEKWGGQLPSANVFSRMKGISVSIPEINNFASQIESAISQLDTNQYACPTPVPVSTATPAPTPDYSGYTLIKNEKLETRDVADLQRRYITATTKTYAGNCCTSKCGNDLKGGNALTCTDYELQPETIPDVLRQLNFYRELAGVPHEVINNESLNYGCYVAAQYLSAKGKLSHTVIKENDRTKCGQWNSNWQLVKDSLAQSNLAQGDVALPPLKMIDGLMDDLGDNNAKEVGHRRWFLYPYLTTIGFGFYPLAIGQYGGYNTETKETGVFRVSHNSKGDYVDYPGIPFIAWPAPGPFPVARIPESFSLTFTGFKDVSVSDITIKMTRDDGEVLSYDSIYLDYKNEISSLSYCLIWKLSYSSIQLCTASHTLHVQVIIEKTKKIVDYTIEFFDNNPPEVACFYATDKSKCPDGLAETNIYGPGQYSNFQSSASQVTVKVVEDVTLTSDLVLTSKKVLFQGSKVRGNIIIGSSTTLDISDPTESNVVVQCKPSDNNLECGTISTTIQPQTLKLVMTTLPTYKGRTNKVLVYSGLYVEFDYQKEIETTDYIYYYSIYYTGTSAYLSSIPQKTSKNLCYKKDLPTLPGGCTVFNDFSEIKNHHSPSIKIYKLYIPNDPINLSTVSFPNDFGSSAKYIVYSNLAVQLEYSSSLNSRVRELYIEPASAKNTLDTTFTIVNSEHYPSPYYNQEIYAKRYPLKNVFLSRYTTNNNQYQIPGLIGDATAIQVTSTTEEKVYDETQSDFTNGGSYQYTDSNNYPLFITNARYYSYTFTTTNSQANIRVQPSKENEYTTVELNFPSQATNFASIYIQDYGYVTIKASSDLFSKIRLINVKEAKFVDFNGNAVSGISTDVIGNETIDWSSSSQVTFETLNFRTDTIAKLGNCQVSNANVYDANPVIQGLKITNLKLVRSSPTLKDCQVTGSVTINIVDDVFPAIQLIGDSSNFNPSSITVHISSPIADLSLLLAGLSTSQVNSLKSKITIEGSTGTTYKVVASKDQKGLYVANADFNENDAPAVVESTNNFLIKEYRIDSETFALNPPPPGFEYTDSILFPLDKPSNSPTPAGFTSTEPTTVPTTEPTTAPTTEPTTAPTTGPTTAPTTEPTNEPTKVSTPKATPIFVTPEVTPEPDVAKVPITDITESQEDDTIRINTDKIQNPSDSKLYETEIDSSAKKVVVSNTQNINFQLTVTDNSAPIEVAIEDAESTLLIHGDNGANLQLKNSENMDISGKGTFVLNPVEDESLTINKLLPTEKVTLETSKSLTVNNMRVHGTVAVDGNQKGEEKVSYNIHSVVIEGGSKLESNYLKFYSIEIEIGGTLGYFKNSDFADCDFQLSYKKEQSTVQLPIEFSTLDDMKNPPKSISLAVSKDSGLMLSEDRFVIAQKDFTGQNVGDVTKEQVDAICEKWVKSYTSNDSDYDTLSYETEFSNGKLQKVTLFAAAKSESKPPNDGKGGKKGGMSIGIIVGIAAAAVVVVVAIVVVVVIVIKRKRNYESSTGGAAPAVPLPKEDGMEAEDIQDAENKDAAEQEPAEKL